MVMVAHTGQLLRQRPGLTIIEVLVAIAIIGLLASLLAPAVMLVRETSRKASCASRLRQIGVAIHSYHSDYLTFPMNYGKGHNTFHVAILPYLDQAPLHQWIINDTAPFPSQYQTVPVMRCPSAPSYGDYGSTNYGKNYGSGFQRYEWNGFVADKNISDRDIYDGLTQTVAMAELKDIPGNHDLADVNRPLDMVWETQTPLWLPGELEQFADLCETMPLDLFRATDLNVVGWIAGSSNNYFHVLPPQSRSCLNGFYGVWAGNLHAAISASSYHSEGCNTLFADGSVRYVGQIDRKLWSALGSRNGNESVSWP